jgi:hypothetical protein
MSAQPVWKFLANLGDVSPLEYGGYFVYEDTTGVYMPEAEVLLIDDETDDPHYTIHRVVLERCTFINGVLSDNKFHPDYPAWFAQPEDKRPQDTTKLSRICETMDITQDELIRLLCSENAVERAQGYRNIGEYHGWNNFDDYPMKMRKRELRKRYLEKNGEKY